LFVAVIVLGCRVAADGCSLPDGWMAMMLMMDCDEDNDDDVSTPAHDVNDEV
jgi:hypothetical protein